MLATPGLTTAERTVLEEVRVQHVYDAARTDPKALIAEMRGFDPTAQEWFGFTMYRPDQDPFWPYEERRGLWPHPESEGWVWQAAIVDWWHDPVLRKFLILKARQLGITWLAVAYGIWLMLFRPGAAIVCYSYDEEQAKKLIQRAWLMFQSLPEYFRRGFTVITPQKSDLPSEFIRLRHDATGVLSTMQALPATKKAGHGDTVTWGIMDEVSRMDYAREIYAAINPATSRGGRLALISTANGVSNADTGQGNFFHHLYDTKEEKGVSFRFLPWHLHPERGDHGDEGRRPVIEGPGRDPDWYQREAMALPTVERNQQYPLNETDAFMLSGATYFEAEDLQHYRQHTMKPIFRGIFEFPTTRKAVLHKADHAPLQVFTEPEKDGKYVMGVDVASGTGQDRSVASVRDTRNGQLVAQFRGKVSPQDFGDQVYWLGRWYGTAKIAVETQGGWGEAVIARLRDGYLGRPVYPNLYRHTDVTKGKRPIAEKYGMPMNVATRPAVLAALWKHIRDRVDAYLPQNEVSELGTFVYAESRPSPRAQDGCHDDIVMADAIAVYMLERHSPAASAPNRGHGQRKGYQPLPTRSY